MRSGAVNAGIESTSRLSHESVGRWAKVRLFTRAMSWRQARSSAYLQGSSISSVNSARQEKSSSGYGGYSVVSAPLWEGQASRTADETDGDGMVGSGFEVKDTIEIRACSRVHGTVVQNDQGLWMEAARAEWPDFSEAWASAYAAAPRRAQVSSRITRTGMDSSKGESRPLSRNACMNAPSCSVFRIFGAMPPPRYIPPVASTFRAILPVSAPYAPAKIFMVSKHRELEPSSAHSPMTALGSSLSMRSRSQLGSSIFSTSRKNS